MYGRENMLFNRLDDSMEYFNILCKGALLRLQQLQVGGPAGQNDDGNIDESLEN